MKRRYVTLTSAVQSAVLMSCLLGSMKLAAQATGSAALAPMWSNQVVPDLDGLTVTPPGKNPKGEKMVVDVDRLASAYHNTPAGKFRLMKMNDAVAGDAFAGIGKDGKWVIYYAASFEADGEMPRDEYLGKYITLAHEISHHLLGHTASHARPITQQDELMADQLGACLFSYVVRQLRKPLGPEDHVRKPVYYDEFEPYFLKKHGADPVDGLHAKAVVRLKWLNSGFAYAPSEGHCNDMPAPKP